MSFKCSVFGHRFGDAEVEREREEQGSEVVITITETEACQRCGETRIVSENKEVTSLETPSDIVSDDIEDEESETVRDNKAVEDTGTVDDSSTETVGDTTTEDAEFITETTDDEPAVEDAMTETASVDDTTESPETDDAVILDDDEDEAENREPGEWPDESDDTDDDWTPGSGQELRPVEDEQPETKPTKEAISVPTGEFYCPECEFTTDVESSSLREGDFCPECHRGSLAHRETED